MVKIFYINACFFEMFVGTAITYKLYPEFRSEKTVIKVLSTIFLMIYMYVFTFNMWENYISTIAILFYSVGFAVLYRLFWHSDFLKVLLLQLFYCTNVSLLKIPVITLKGILLHGNVIQANQGQRVFGEAIYNFVIVFLIYILLKRYKIVEVTLRQLLFKNKLLCVLIITLEWNLLGYCMNIGHFGFETVDFIFNLLFVLCATMVIVSLTIFFTYQQMKNEKLLQQENYEHLKNQYYGLKELYETNSRWVHDAKHEFLYIGSCLEEKNVSGAYESLQNYLQKLRKIEKKVWSGFSFLDFMLNYKKMEMDKKNINFTLDEELKNITIPEEDLVIILGNLLDNAIEAAQKCEASERYIKLKLRNLNNMVLLNLENGSSEMPLLKNDIFISNKQEEGVHGLGIESVRRIVETYEGEIYFQYTEKDFQVQILI